MPSHPLDQALTLQRDGHDGLTTSLSGDYSNGPVSAPPEAGFPFGGLVAALCAVAMRDGLELTTAPLRTLSVQYLAAARFETPLRFAPRLLRGGRSVAYAAIDVCQAERVTHHATAVFGADGPGDVRAERTPPPPLAALDPAATLSGPMTPRFAQQVEYRFDDGPRILGGNADRAVVERTWMRIRGGRPLDAPGLCYLLDALYPPAWTASRQPAPMTTVDLRYDLLVDPTPETAPDGWAFFEFRMLDLGLGWTVDEATAWGADGAPLAVSRQRRKLLPQRSARR